MKIDTTLKTRTKKILFYSLAALLTGCIPSLHSLYTEKDTVFDERLLGDWLTDDPKWEWKFEKHSDPNSYKLTVTDDEGKGEFIAHLVKLNDMLFIDLYPGEPQSLKSCDLWQFHVLPVHTFMKVEQIEPIAAKMRMMNPKKMQEMLENDPNVIKHEIIEDDRIVLTASTNELQEFMKKHANDEDFFSDLLELERQKSKDPNAPQTVEPNENTKKE